MILITVNVEIPPKAIKTNEKCLLKLKVIKCNITLQSLKLRTKLMLVQGNFHQQFLFINCK